MRIKNDYRIPEEWCVSVHEILILADGIGDSGNER